MNICLSSVKFQNVSIVSSSVFTYHLLSHTDPPAHTHIHTHTLSLSLALFACAQMLKTPREIKRDCIKLLDILGKGHFGEVHKGTIREG